jgi:hypothetical protein
VKETLGTRSTTVLMSTSSVARTCNDRWLVCARPTAHNTRSTSKVDLPYESELEVGRVPAPLRVCVCVRM